MARLILVLIAATLAVPAGAQDAYPMRTVRFIVPFPAATPPDFLARLAAPKLSEAWNVPVVVEVRDGAGGAIGVSQVVKAAPDGYTLLFTNDLPIVIAPAVSKTTYDPRKDLAPLAAVAQSASVLVVHPAAAMASMKDLVAAAKAKPGALTFASSGDASTSRMCVELIRQATGIELLQVPYKGAAPAIQAVLAGEVTMYCSPVFQALPHLRSGKLKALGMTGPRPSPQLPEIPTMASQGLADVVTSIWYGAFAPSGTPPAALGKIRESLKKVFDDPETRQRVVSSALEPIWLEGADLGAAVQSDLEKWTRVVRTMGLKAN